jgi:hypothetical protein
VHGVRQGKPTHELIPAELITTETIKGLRGDRWEGLAGITWYAIYIEVGAPSSPKPASPEPSSPKFPDATDEQIHAAIDAVYTRYEQAGEPAPNLTNTRQPVQALLKDQGLYAEQSYILELASDKKYKGRRGKPGPRRGSYRRS